MKANLIDNNLYQKNLQFWEDAWQRVKNPVHKIPDTLAYIKDIPGVFAEYDCQHILDIACGSGWLSFYLNEFGFKVTGVDISQSAIKLAGGVLEQRKANPEAKLFDDSLSVEKINLDDLGFVVADMFMMPFLENSFDGILINAAFEHLDYARGNQFLAQIKRLIKPDGIMFAVFDKVATGSRGEFDVLEDGTHQYHDTYRNGMFLRNYSDEELDELLRINNWQVLSLSKNSFESRIVIARNLR